MAVGARITSTNLSGKTATVTFTPYTGQTSGSTVNLGTKTIPFNNITNHPYGNYAIYLAEYDYTYTLNIPEPVTDSQLYVYTSKMVNDNNWGAATLNFNDFTATVIDLNVDTNLYYINNLYPLTNSGFGYQFQGQNDSSNNLIIFTDASNTELFRYSGTTNNYDFEDLDGRWVVFFDYDNGIVKYFNGVDLYTYEYDASRYQLDLQWDYDVTMSNKSFIIVKYDMTQGIDHHAVLFKPDGTQTILKSWTNSSMIDYNFQVAYNSDIFAIEGFDYDNGVYTQVEICNVSGTTLETISLSGNSYNNRDYGFVGTNKYFFIVHNYNDENVDYKIVHYNFNTSNLIETSHVKGPNYQNRNTRYDSPFWPSNQGSENLVLSFFNNNYNWNGWGYECQYLDFMYIFGNQTSFTTFTFADNQTKHIIPWLDQTGTNMFRTRCDNGDGVASIFTITSGATNMESLNINVSSITDSNYWSIDDRTVYLAYTDGDYTGATMNLIGLTGGTQDTKSLQFYASYGESVSANHYRTFYFGCNSVTLDGYGAWYVNDNTTTFTQTGYYYWTNYANDFYKPDFLDNSDMVLYHYGENTARVLTATGISNEFSLTPWNNNKGIRVGDTMFIHYYNDVENGYYHVKLYDFDGTLLNTLDTTYTDYNDMIASKDKFVARFWDPNTNAYVMYLISANNIASVSLEDYNTYQAPNDYISWD